MWNRYLERTPQHSQSRDRTHRDGIYITPQSPEAFEEILWMSFFEGLHDPGRTAVLGAETDHRAFETFYRDHIRKLLLVRAGRRYLAKGNYNVTRMSYLLKVFPDARFVVPVREPIWHVASLMKQHRRFCEGQKLSPRALTHLQRIGHFEFGLDRRPINTGDHERVQHILELWESGAEVEGWATYWALIHDFLAAELTARPGLHEAVRVVRYESFCNTPHESVSDLFRHCGLPADPMLLDHVCGMIRQPSREIPDIFSYPDLALIARCTAESAQRLGLGTFQGRPAKNG
jgi:hypothetical protein